MLQNQVFQPKIIVIRRKQNQGYGFTLRHFIAYPPDTSDSYQRKAMETIFIKEVHSNGPAHLAGLQTGDRVLMVNNSAVAGISYSSIVTMIKQTPNVLRLQVVPKECDVLQMYYTDIAHTSETNRQADIIRPQIPITATNTTTHNFHLNQRMISYSPEGCGGGGNSSNSNNSGQYNQTTSFCANNLYDSPRIVIQQNSEGCNNLRPKPSNLSVLQKPNNNDNNDFMIRLRKSIEQKEEFLKSPIPHNQSTFIYHHNQKQQSQQHQQILGFPNISNSATTTTSSTTRSVVKNIVKQTNDMAVTTTMRGINNSNNNSNINNNNNNSKLTINNKFNQQFPTSSSSSNTLITTEYNNSDKNIIIHNPHILRDTNTRKQTLNSIVSSNNCNNIINISNNSSCAVIATNGSSNSSVNSNSNNTIKDKFHKELEFLESLPEMGVTNQVFERKLVSNLAKGFDPFKPLSINTGTNASIESNADKKIYKLESSSRKSVTAVEFELMDFHQKQRTDSCKSIDNSLLTKPSLQAESKDDDSSPENGEIDDFIAMQKTCEVVRRCKPAIIDDNKPMRRISYLRATNNELNEYQIDLSTMSANIAVDENLTAQEKCKISSSLSSTVQIDMTKSESVDKDAVIINGKIDIKDEVFETEMEIKSSCIYGKRISEYRSWRQAKIELNGNILKICPVRSSKSENNVIEFNVKNFNVLDESIDKKKFVFRLQSKPRINNKLEIPMVATTAAAATAAVIDAAVTPLSTTAATTTQNNEKNYEYTEILFKTKSITEMKKLFGLLQEISEFPNHNSQGKQLAEPQMKAATSSVSTNTYCDESTTIQTTNVQINTKEYSPLLSSKTTTSNEFEMLTTTDSISPIMKTRKSSQQQTKIITDKDLGSPKAKNWKDLLFRRIHGNSGDHISSSSSSSPSINMQTNRLIGSIGVPLKSCPMSKENEFVPNIVEVCTNIVETKGLNVIGIYRIPGNKAAISELKEQVNKIDFTWDTIETDIRWDDVNVVSSLLKLFIRTLPDALLPSTFYINFIEADKKTGERRLYELKQLIQTLPEHSYETMKHLIRHLRRVSKNCQINLMEPKNLAIIFGPSIIRTPNETLEIAVKDMKHQCRIVELLLTQYDYFFENGALPELEPNSPPIINESIGSHQDQTTLLLDNVSKIEQRYQDKESLTSRFIPHLRRRTHSKRSAINSDTYSGESILSLEYKKIPEIINKENTSRIITTSNTKHLERGNVEISILLTDEDSSNSRISDTGSMSLTTITDTLDSKLRNLRSGSESTDDTTDSPNTSIQIRTYPTLHQHHQQQQQQRPLVHHENIPYADESPERHLITTTLVDNNIQGTGGLHLKHLPITTQHQQQRNPNFIRDITKNINSSRFSSVYESSCSDDSEVSTTSDPKESIIISPLFPERYKKRRDYRLFRSASFNCRNYSSRSNQNYSSNTCSSSGCIGSGGGGITTNSNLTKDEKTDMNLTKKRQIQNKQNRSIKRRHTVGGPHDYSTTNVQQRRHHHRHHHHNPVQQNSFIGGIQQNNNHHDNGNHVLEVGIRIKNVSRRN